MRYIENELYLFHIYIYIYHRIFRNGINLRLDFFLEERKGHKDKVCQQYCIGVTQIFVLMKRLNFKIQVILRPTCDRRVNGFMTHAAIKISQHVGKTLCF